MDQKQKEQLVKLYLELADDQYYYKSIDDYINHALHIYNKYCLGKSMEEQILVYLTLLYDNSGRKIVYLGAFLALKEDDMKFLNDALNTATTIMQLSTVQSGYDHCSCGFHELPTLLCANRFKDIENIFPKEYGLSKNGYGLNKALTNLIMYLYYREEAWREQALKDGMSVLNKKNPMEIKAVVSCLICLVGKDFDKFSTELNNVCKGKRKSQMYGENKFTKSFSPFALGLYNFAYYLYGKEVNNITLPKDESFLMELHEYQKSINYQVGDDLFLFKEPLTLLDKLIHIELPPMLLFTENKKNYVDIKEYRKEVIERIMKQSKIV